MPKIIKFTDIGDRERLARASFDREKPQLEAKKAALEKQAAGGNPSSALQEELKRISDLLTRSVVDPLYTAVQGRLRALTTQQVDAHDKGRFPSSLATPPVRLTPAEKQLAAVYGLLQLNNETAPAAPRFGIALTEALGEYTSNQPLYDAVLALMIDDGDMSRQDKATSGQVELFLNARNWVAVGRALKTERVDKDDQLLPLKVRVALAKVSGSSDGQPSSIVAIDLPDLEQAVAVEIAVDNLEALQALYYTMVLEEMKLFQARDIAVEQWQLGMIVTGRGRAGDLFYQMWRKSPDRFSEMERMSLYYRCFGFPGGTAVHGQPNRDFKNLWMRFLSAVSSLVRQYSVDTLIRATIPAAVHQEQVRQSGRDLAANLSLHGFGIAYFAATELQQEITDIIELFSEPEVKAAYASRDMYQVVEQIMLFAGGQVESSVQKRVTANAGAVIIRWLANNASRLSTSNLQGVLDIQSILAPLPVLSTHKPTREPTDADLVNAVEQWLAVNGIQDQFIEQNAQAMEPPRTPTRPIQVPAIARDVLDTVGISTGYSSAASNGASNGIARRYNGGYARA